MSSKEIFGTRNDDIIYGDPAGDLIIYGGSGDDTLYAFGGHNTLYGGKGNDSLHANDDGDILYGNDGNDILFGGIESAQLFGNNGNDTLVAETGFVTMTGGNGADIFKFLDVTGQADTVTDFHPGINDRIDLSNILHGFDPVTQAIADFVHSTRIGNDTMISVDVQGAAHFTDLVLLQGVHSFDPAAMLANGHLMT